MKPMDPFAKRTVIEWASRLTLWSSVHEDTIFLFSRDPGARMSSLTRRAQPVKNFRLIYSSCCSKILTPHPILLQLSCSVFPLWRPNKSQNSQCITVGSLILDSHVRVASLVLSSFCSLRKTWNAKGNELCDCALSEEGEWRALLLIGADCALVLPGPKIKKDRTSKPLCTKHWEWTSDRKRKVVRTWNTAVLTITSS